MTPSNEPSPSRRLFLKQSTTALAGATVLSTLAPSLYAAEDNTVNIALIGCGGRGTGAAADALNTSGPTRLIAMADVFPDRLNSSLKTLQDQFGAKIDVPPDRRFLGFDACRKAVDSLGKNDLVLLTTPAAFRPAHFEYAVLKGRNVFMEKSFGVDGPGIRRILKAGQSAKEQNLKIATGLMWRHDMRREELMRRIHEGQLGDIILSRCYRMHGPVGFGNKRPGESELAHQIRNYNSFTWLNGSFIVDWLIHDIDICCWSKNDWPVNAQGHGGRQVRTIPDQMYDHFAVEYTFADGSKFLVQGRHIDNCYNLFSEFFHGSKGSAAIWDALGADPSRIYKNQNMTRENETWRYAGPTPNPYQREHDLLFEAIRKDLPYNETERSAKACMTSILGRMAAESGQLVTFDQALASNLDLAPGLESFTMDSPAPVNSDATGKYPIAMPGQTKAL